MPEIKPLKAEDVPSYADLVIYDDVLPSAASPFRTLEYGHYLDFFPSSVLVSLEAWHFGFAHSGFGDLRASLPIEERLKSRILGPEVARDIVPRLAYVTFLGNAQRLLSYFEARRIPFILQLYPGGSFEPNVEASDRHLHEVVHSPLCRKVITTQTLTREHLLQRIDCDPAKIEFIYGGVFDSRVGFDFARDKRLFGTHKDTIDLCFVAHRYGSDMAQKGYDQFVEVARLLAADDPRLRFHVVGDYRPDDLPLGDAASRFTFYGPQPSAFFADFYPRMDVILSANKPASLSAGAFDGFPTGACMEAGFRGVLNCITDPLRLNAAFEDEQNILLVDRDAARTVQRLAALFATPDRLYALARANWERFREVFDIDRQLWARTRLITAELLREEALITRPAAPFSSMDHSAAASASAATAEAEQRLGALVAEYAKLAAALDEANRYGEERHDALLVEYQKLAVALEAVKAYEREQYGLLLAEHQRVLEQLEETSRRAQQQSAAPMEERRMEAAPPRVRWDSGAARMLRDFMRRRRRARP